MSRYYTPTIDEFCDGFEFETRIDDNWIPSDYCISVKEYELSDLRVKYLDADDLKDLGFSLKNNVNDVLTFRKNVVGENILYYDVILSHIGNMSMIEIRSMKNEVILSKIHIKNKHELKWILSRYGIL